MNAYYTKDQIAPKPREGERWLKTDEYGMPAGLFEFRDGEWKPYVRVTDATLETEANPDWIDSE